LGIIPERRQEIIAPPFEELTMLIYGMQGCGKTTFCNGDQNSITIAAEPGSEFVETRAVPTANWDTFLDVVTEAKKGLETDPNFCTGVVVDIVDNLFEMCRDYICKQLGISFPGEKKDFGKSWSEISKEWKAWLSYVMRFSNVRFISHMTERTIERTNEHGLMEEITQLLPRFHSGQGAKFLDGVCRMVGYMYVNKSGRHCITFRPNAYNGAKDRTGILKDLSEIVLPEDPKAGFRYVSDLYTKRAKEQGITIKSRRDR